MSEAIVEKTVLDETQAMVVAMLLIGDQIEEDDRFGVIETIGTDRVGTFMAMMVEKDANNDLSHNAEHQVESLINLLNNIFTQLGV